MNNLAVVKPGCNPPVAAAPLGVAKACGSTGGALEAALVAESVGEMMSAAGLASAPAPVRAAARVLFAVLSRRLAKTLARFDTDVGNLGISIGAARALHAFGVSTQLCCGALPAQGPLLVVANHPGAYDALVLMDALGRDDLAIVAADRVFLRALPEVASRLVFVGVDASSSARGVRRALAHLRAGGALLQFGAGRIEPDAAFAAAGDGLVEPWSVGTGALVRVAARAGAKVAVVTTAGVHSERAKRAAVVRFAEARGVTTFAPLLQIAVPGFGDVRVTVTIGDAHDARGLAASYADDGAIAEALRCVAARQLDAVVAARRSSLR